MQFIGRALVASAFVLGACAGGDNANTNAGDTNTAGAAGTGATASAPAAQAPAGGGQATAITGTTHEVRMVLQGTEYKYVPATISVRPGDAIRYINESGGPHNVDFSIANLPANVQTQLAANMPENADNMTKLGPVNGPLLTTPNATYVVSFAGIPAGTYAYQCTPHAAMGMKGQVTVQ
jgi:plastocyanin